MLPMNENRPLDSAEDDHDHERRVENELSNEKDYSKGKEDFVRVEDKDYQEKETESKPLHHHITSTEDREEDRKSTRWIQSR